jgi:hypothetical protein
MFISTLAVSTSLSLSLVCPASPVVAILHYIHTIHVREEPADFSIFTLGSRPA